jgi:hypothetical protein
MKTLIFSIILLLAALISGVALANDPYPFWEKGTKLRYSYPRYPVPGAEYRKIETRSGNQRTYGPVITGFNTYGAQRGFYNPYTRRPTK